MNDMKRRLAEITKEKRYRNSADVVLLNRDGDLEKTVLAIQRLIRNAVGNTSTS
jgi:hypothetical protein